MSALFLTWERDVGVWTRKAGGKGGGEESGDTADMTNEFTEIRGAN